MMKPWVWLRIAAVLQALGIVGHNLSTLSTEPTHGPAEQAVFDAMRGFQFDILGSTRSNRDFYRGYQFMTTVNFCGADRSADQTQSSAAKVDFKSSKRAADTSPVFLAIATSTTVSTIPTK